MADSQLLAVGTGAANSLDFDVADTPVTLELNDAAGPDLPYGCKVEIYRKGAGGQYYEIGALRSDTIQQRTQVVSATGTYRVSRTADSAACGVSRS